MSPVITPEELIFDAEHIWHPYSTTINRVGMFPVVGAEGVYLHLNDGRRIIDGMSSWWCMVHGYNHPEMNAALKRQIDDFSHVMFGGLTHKPAIDLAKKLVAMTPEPMQTVFFADSGSVAVEVAIKMAMQYWIARERPEKNKMLTVRGGYYGDTTGGMSICDPDGGMHHWFTGILPQHYFVPRPECRVGEAFQERHMDELRQILERRGNQLAGVIIEPVVQGAGGMYFYSPEYLEHLRQLCDDYEVLLVHDEIATGFGRTGKLFACEHAGVVPDIMCVGKALTGGYLTMAATLCSEQVSHIISEHGPFMHGPTFMANPLACAAGNASLEILSRGEWHGQLAAIEKKLREGLMPCVAMPAVADVRVLGGIGVVELKEPVVMSEIQPLFVAEGVWVRPFGKLVYVMPPYVISSDELKALCSAICRVLHRVSH
ncbi:adenosylmethionine--8-amino-7-oxononanoate transaminase [Endozoicomonas sp. YOMI1]|uniref:adenosylmethionine--8-amino-7-oxononanoate transaminase n=1 Tax=Endozoicomonas sp. YOMI1 TaxID=2828739 RepID=UPI002148CE9F|nr:adenosylmethionine--8-amino-7-oxononanoate transaminase [Endozoicomonas sp. YOMI1]